MSITGAFILPHPPIILPAVGKEQSSKLAKTTEAYKEACRQIAALQPETVVVASPHLVMYADYFHISPGESAEGDMGRFQAPDAAVQTRYDTEFAAELAKQADSSGIPAGALGERDKSLDHGTLIPLWFLEQAYRGYRTVRVGLSGLPPIAHYQLGRCIAQAAEKLKRRTVFIASGDLSHRLLPESPYGFAPQGPRFDQAATEAMARGDFLRLLSFEEAFCDAAGECGLRAFQIMAGALDGQDVQARLLSYEGPFGVGYAVASFIPDKPDESRRIGEIYLAREREQMEKRKAAEDPYVRLARMSLETFVKTGLPAKLPQGLPTEITARRAGVFVSLKKHGRLRGCIGTIRPVMGNIGEEILCNAISACSRDPRFDPVEPKELEQLVYSVDVLGEAEPVSSLACLDVKRYGVIVTSGQKKGLLLPNLEGVDTVERQVAIAKEKAGISSGEPCSLERFEVVRHQ